MKRFAKTLTLAAAALAVACSSSPNNIQFANQTFTLQGVVADAISGQRIGGDLKLYLVQGSDVRGPSRLISNTADPLAGEYAFAGIPASTNCNNSSFKVVAVKSNYQRFESEITFCFNRVTLPGSQVEVLDSVLTKIGNIYLYPVGVASPDYRYTVNYNGAPVAGATVQLDPNTDSNSGLFSTNNNTLTNSAGYVASLSGQTDANGHVTFAGTSLALGGVYSVQVLPFAMKNSSGSVTQLGLFTSNQSLNPGQSSTDILLNLSSVQSPLYATSASNRAVGQLTPSGQLVITFSAPVTLNNPTKFSATMAGGGAAVLSGTQPVNATLSGDGLTLTLAPNFTTPPASTDKNVSITYANGTAFFVPKDSPAISYVLFGNGGGAIHFLDGSNLGQTVQISGP